MRSMSLILIFCAATAMADTFGPERPLTSAAQGQVLPALSITTNGIVALWNSGGTVGGRAPWGQQIGASAGLPIDPVEHRDGSVASIGDESLLTWVENDWLYGVRLDATGQAIGPP